MPLILNPCLYYIRYFIYFITSYLRFIFNYLSQWCGMLNNYCEIKITSLSPSRLGNFRSMLEIKQIVFAQIMMKYIYFIIFYDMTFHVAKNQIFLCIYIYISTNKNFNITILMSVSPIPLTTRRISF